MPKDQFDLDCKRCNIDFTVHVPQGVFFKPRCPGCGRDILLPATQLRSVPQVTDTSPKPQVQTELF